MRQPGSARDILGLEFGQTAGLAVEPGDTVDLHYSRDVAREFRMLSIFGPFATVE